MEEKRFLLYAVGNPVIAPDFHGNIEAATPHWALEKKTIIERGMRNVWKFQSKIIDFLDSGLSKHILKKNSTVIIIAFKTVSCPIEREES